MKEPLNKCDCENCDLKGLFYSNVEDDVIVQMCNNKVEKFHQKGDVIAEAGKPIEHFSYLKSGLVKLSKPGVDGKGQIIMIAKPFDFVSLLSIFSDSK